MKILAKAFSNKGHKEVDYILRLSSDEIAAIHWALIHRRPTQIKRDGKEVIKNTLMNLTKEFIPLYEKIKKSVV